MVQIPAPRPGGTTYTVGTSPVTLVPFLSPTPHSRLDPYKWLNMCIVWLSQCLGSAKTPAEGDQASFKTTFPEQPKK